MLRRPFAGSYFVISVLRILGGGVDDSHLSDGCHSYVVPVEWIGHKMEMLVGVAVEGLGSVYLF